MASLDPVQFKVVLGKAPKQAATLHLEFQKKLVLEGLRRIVLQTPVDTGRARANWLARRGFGSERVNNAARDRSGTSAIAAGSGILDRITLPYGLISIFNNVNYITFLEQGSSQQAPSGMVGTTIPFLRRLAERAGFQNQFRFSRDLER